ncbi:hypothetical protein Dip518_001027 [Parelusimicrobium proximum]|uniref:tetratricopeptide repeat protein n=1 Tax=Parelusimicrobium proximum TaxID=3228953 RepID=UPI003D17CFCB
MKKVFFCILSAAMLFTALKAEEITAENNYALPADGHKFASDGMKAMYALEMDAAFASIQMAEDKYPGHPYITMGKIIAEWTRYDYEYDKTDKEQAKKFISLLNDSITSINTWLKTHPQDAHAYFALGGAYGMKGRMNMESRSWVSAYFNARKGVKLLNKALETDPELYDAYYGLGMYEYYAGTLPGVVKVLGKIVSIKGNTAKGIEYLELAKEKGDFTKDAAHLLLTELYINRFSAEFDAEKGITLAKEFIKKYPAPPLYRYMLITGEYENGNYDEVIKLSKELISKIGKAKFYTDLYLPRAYGSYAAALMAQGKYKEAQKILETAKEKSFDDKPATRWSVYNIYRLGNVYDALDMRTKAVEMYRIAAAADASFDIREDAGKKLKTPFSKDTPAGPIFPL